MEILEIDPEMQMLAKNKQSGYDYRRRRHDDWTEIYDFYRGKVQYNRLTQRQSIHIPLMKQSIRSLMKDVDDMPVLYFENLDNDKQAEVFKNEYWKYTAEQNRLELQDIIDKRQVFLFGRTYDQMQIVDGKVKLTVQDPMDILISRYADPFNIHSSRFLIHTHIFVPLASLKENKQYDQSEIAKLEQWLATDDGEQKSSDNQQMLIEKTQKMQDIGDNTALNPVLGETYVELTLHFVYRKESFLDEQLFLYVEAEGLAKLLKKPLEMVVGKTSDNFFQNHYTYNSWADDLERQDWYSDAIGDVLRPINKVLDAWASQMVENRTLKSLGMRFFDNTTEGFTPQTWQPQAFGFYGVPGKPNEIMQDMTIPDLSDSLKEVQFFIEIAEKASGATATQQGQQTERSVTLGEVELALGEAKERIKGMSKFYTPAWQQRGEMFVKMLEAAGDKIDAVTLYKQGRNTDNIYAREVAPKDWKSKAGYRCKVWSQDDKETQDTKSLSVMSAVKTNMPDNPIVDEEYKRKLLEYAKLSPDKITEAMKYEDEKRQAMVQGGMMGMPGGLQPATQPQLGQPTPSIQPGKPAQMALPARAGQ
jgi:hypothetical protein